MSANQPPHDPNKAAQMARQTSQGAGGAGKSLALMQQRLQMANTNKTEVVTPLSAPNPLVGVPAPGPLPAAPPAPGVRPMPVAPPTQQVIPPARPKGKDFSAMANSAKHKPQQPQVVAAVPAPAPPVAAPVAPSRPKGKDFSAMASRMAAPVPAVPAVSPTSTAERVAAARAAAGYTVPAGSVHQAKAAQQQTVPTTRPAAVPPATAVLAAEQARQQRIARMKQSQKHDAAGAIAKAQMATQPASSSRRSSGSSSGRKHASAQKTLPPPSTKPTQQPSSSEGRLAPSAHTTPLVGQRLKDLVASLDPHYGLDAQAETQLLQLADEFLEKVVKSAMRLAQHRGSKTMDVPDIQLVLAKQWGISVPGLGAPTFKASKPGSRVVASSSSNKRRGSASAAGANDTAKRAKVSMASGATNKSAPSTSQQS